MVKTAWQWWKEKIMGDDYESEFLFARPSFLEGAARVLDLGGTLNEYNISRDGAEADRRAFAADLRAIGKDMRQVVKQFARENNLPEYGE